MYTTDLCSWLQFKMVSIRSGKPMRAPPRLSEIFASVAFRTLQVLAWFPIGFSRPFSEDRRALPLYVTSPGSRWSDLCLQWCPRLLNTSDLPRRSLPVMSAWSFPLTPSSSPLSLSLTPSSSTSSWWSSSILSLSFSLWSSSPSSSFPLTPECPGQ